MSNGSAMRSETQNGGGKSNLALLYPLGCNPESKSQLESRYIGNQAEEVRKLATRKKDSSAFKYIHHDVK